MDGFEGLKHGIIEHQKTWGIGPPNLFKRHALNHVDRYRRGRHMIKTQNLSVFINMNNIMCVWS